VDVGRALDRFGGGDALVVRRESDKGLARTVDVRRTLRRLVACEDASARERLDWDGGDMLSFGVSVSHEGSARPIEVIEALLGPEIAAETDLARRALWGEQGGERVDPLRLSAFRTRPTAPSSDDETCAPPSLP